MSARGRSPKLSSKGPPLYSPRLDGVGILTSRAVPPSPLSKGLDGLSGSGALPSVDYDDVFGGPPRFATTMLASQSGPAPSAVLDRTTARTPSFRSPSLPVFELPVFGDDAARSSSTFDPRSASVAYEDIFREEVQTPDVFPGSNVYMSISRSKSSSRPSSRRMSPVHPAATLASQLEQEEILAAANSAAYFKGRSIAGKLSSRCSFSSFSSFDERGRPPDSPSMPIKNDTLAASLPSSPPQTGTWGNVKRFSGSSSANNLANEDFDDVFGGFPQRTYSQAFASIQHGVKDAPKSTKAHNGGLLSTKSGVSSRVQSAPYGSEPYNGLNQSPTSSSSSNEDEGLHDDFIEIRMDRHSDTSVLEKVESTTDKVWVTVNDLNLSTQSTPKRAPARPPPAPITPLKYKSWKDWTSESQSAGNPSPASLVPNAAMAADTTASEIKKDFDGINSNAHFVKGLVESGFSEQLRSNSSSAQQLLGKYTGSLPLGSEIKVKVAEDALKLEERELKAMLTNAWIINEKRERKKSSAKVLQEVPTVVEPKALEARAKEGKKHSTKQPKVSESQQRIQNLEDREAQLQWKSWRKYSSKGGMESTKNGFANDKLSPRVPSPGSRDMVLEKEASLVKMNSLSETEDLFDPEEIVKVVTEEMSTNCSVAATERSDRWAGMGLNTTKAGQRKAEDPGVLTKVQSLKVSKDVKGTASALSSMNGSIQDLVQDSEQIEVSLSGGEDIDCLIGLDKALEGFQEIEGETSERRKGRWERHLRAKERVAKALEEMQQRDAEVQRQQKEKQQLAVTSDRQIKRWATGKEGNLRALLSNLQHVLWPESGWQPISLTDLIEGQDVKKAYRKATLFVHPDKVQQKGATLQQKYIAERVFDILQEAWKTFNMQELF